MSPNVWKQQLALEWIRQGELRHSVEQAQLSQATALSQAGGRVDLGSKLLNEDLLTSRPAVTACCEVQLPQLSLITLTSRRIHSEEVLGAVEDSFSVYAEKSG